MRSSGLPRVLGLLCLLERVSMRAVVCSVLMNALSWSGLGFVSGLASVIELVAP